MIRKLFKRAFACRRMVTGHLGIIFAPFLADLHKRGHTRNTIHQYAQAVEHFGQWLKRRDIMVRQIREHHLQEFLNRHLPHCRCPQPRVRTRTTCRAAVVRFFDFLVRQGVVPKPRPPTSPRTVKSELLFTFDRYLGTVCGLSVSTRRARAQYAHSFLAWRFGDGRVCVRSLKPTDLIKFVCSRATALTSGGLHDLTVGLRSFLRFLEFSKQISRPLSLAVPRPAPVPSNQPPKFLGLAQRRKFLKCFDRSKASGRRDYAMALFLLELGLRAAEVAALTLEDIDWTQMTVRLRHTKQQRERLLPLPAKAARALSMYLKKARPAIASRAVFVRHRAPLGEPLKPHHVRSAIRIAFARCGVDSTGTHILRHTWATFAHQRGLSLKTIADILGHRSLETSNRYAHVNLKQLRLAALPWPNFKK